MTGITILRLCFILSVYVMHWSLLPRLTAPDKDILTVTGIPVGISPEENIVMKAVIKVQGKIFIPWPENSSS